MCCTLTFSNHGCCVKNIVGSGAAEVLDINVYLWIMCTNVFRSSWLPAALLHDPQELGSCISLYSVPVKRTWMWIYAVACLISSHGIWEQFLRRFWRTWELHSTYLQHICLTAVLQYSTSFNTLMASVASPLFNVFQKSSIHLILHTLLGTTEYGRLFMYRALK